MNNLIDFEGICCSGKTTLCEKLSEKINAVGYQSIYNHGAMTYTDIGMEFKQLLGKRDTTITTLYFFTDLILKLSLTESRNFTSMKCQTVTPHAI